MSRRERPSMKRYSTASLIAYSLSVTLLATWLAARWWTYRQILAGFGGKSATMSHEDILAYFSAPFRQRGLSNEAAMLVAGIEPQALAAAIFLIILSSLGFAHRRRPRPTTTEIKKD